MTADAEHQPASGSGSRRERSLTALATGIRPPRQERSRQSLERVLAAGAELLAEKGWDGFTVAEVAQRADASVGLIYRRFHDKAALIEAILITEVSRQSRKESEALDELVAADLPIAELIAAVVHSTATIAYTDARLSQVLSERSDADPALTEHVQRLRTAPRRFTEIMVARRAELAHEDAERAADMAFWITNSAIERRIHTQMWRFWVPDVGDDWPRFVDDLARAVQAYLLCPAPDGSST